MKHKASQTETVDAIHIALQQLADPSRAQILQRFFKTAPGEYAEGDVFLGITVPPLRKLAKHYGDLRLTDIRRLLRSEFHEARLLALLIMVGQFATTDASQRKQLYETYLKHTRYINNWDLVDSSAEHIVGGYLNDRSHRPLQQLARSRLLWERRIAVMATFHFIKRGEYGETLRLCETLLNDPHDLIHKACGWMLREVGKRNRATEEVFLDQHAAVMPRTMLRYAIEKLPERRRQAYLKIPRRVTA